MNASLRLWSLYNMLQSYFPIYKIALSLQELRNECRVMKGADLFNSDRYEFSNLLKELKRECVVHGFIHSAEIVDLIVSRKTPKKYNDMSPVLTQLDDSLSNELKREAIVSIPSERKGYFEHDELFGSKVAAAFPSCERDIQRAGSCYALEQEDACVHHLMLVLERGLHALAANVGVPYPANWQVIINEIEKKLKSLPRGK